MAYKDKYTTSVHGRRLGLQRMTTPETGGSDGPLDFLVGAEALRADVSTAESTGAISAYGVSVLAGTSAASSAVYIIDPPIPGVRKTIVNGSSADGPMYITTKNSETINTTAGTTFTTIKTSAGGSFELVGVTTGVWAGIGLTTGTSSQASGFVFSTST
jgi:hypothetical protein